MAMATLAFDTHKAVKTLTEAGAAEPLAEAMVATIGVAMGENIATKADVADLGKELRQEMADLRREMEDLPRPEKIRHRRAHRQHLAGPAGYLHHLQGKMAQLRTATRPGRGNPAGRRHS